MGRLAIGWRLALEDLMAAVVDPLRDDPRPLRYLSLTALSLIATWFIYVPLHELLHAAGCLLSGGEIESLRIPARYGGALLSKIFDFVGTDAGPYAGRLTDFRPNGDAGYLLTIYAPYLLSLYPGVRLLRRSGRRRNPLLAGPGLVLGLAPFVNIPGDLFELGSVLATRLARHLPSDYDMLRSDDLIRLLRELWIGHERLPEQESPIGWVIVGAIVLLGLSLAVLCAGWTYRLGAALGGRPADRRINGRAPCGDGR